MFPDINGSHPLSALSFSAGMAGYLSGDFPQQAILDYFNGVIASNGGSAMSAQAETDIADMKTVFDGKTIANKIVYAMKVQFYSLLLEQKDLSGITVSNFDNFLELV